MGKFFREHIAGMMIFAAASGVLGNFIYDRVKPDSPASAPAVPAEKSALSSGNIPVSIVVTQNVSGAVDSGVNTRNLAANAEAKFDSISVKSSCYEAIDVAVYFVNPSNKWVTSGWWTLPSGKSITLDVKSIGSEFFLFGKSATSVWNGDDDVKRQDRWIVDSNFEYTESLFPKEPTLRIVSFFSVGTGEQYGDVEAALTCSRPPSK